MPSKVTLTVTEGSLKGQKFIFDSRTTCIIGRAHDCNPKLPNDEYHRSISRYHCLLDINPPAIRVRDFGSKNGTYINGENIGQRQPNQTPAEGAQMQFLEYDLNEGDEIKLCHTVFKVGIEIDSRELINQDTLTNKLAGNNQASKPYLFEVIKRFLQSNDEEESSVTIPGYKILKFLGKGKLGGVYLALHEQTGEEVALKVMLPEVVNNQVAIEKFLLEIQNTKALQHKNIVQLKDSGYADEIFFLTLEYCNAGSIENLMQQRGGRLTIGQALSIILQVLDGLEYAHYADIPFTKLADGIFGSGRGLVHRDLKPANIFISTLGKRNLAKIGDYGLAKAFDIAGLSGQTMSGSKANTPAFMPRQQVIDFKYTNPEVDVWATAASLYYMLTGWLPRNFIGQDPYLTVLQTNAVPIRDRNSTIPKRLAEVIDLALVDKPEIFFKSAAKFKRALLSVI